MKMKPILSLIESPAHVVTLSLTIPSPVHATTSSINILDDVNLNGSIVFNVSSSYSLWFHFSSTSTFVS